MNTLESSDWMYFMVAFFNFFNLNFKLLSGGVHNVRDFVLTTFFKKLFCFYLGLVVCDPHVQVQVHMSVLANTFILKILGIHQINLGLEKLSKTNKTCSGSSSKHLDKRTS